MTNDLDAEHYRTHSSFQTRVGGELLDTLSFRGDETILDVGCGDGRLTAALSKKVPKGQVLGFDPSSSMIDLAASSFSGPAFPNLQFQQASAEELPADLQADLVLVLNAMHWMRKPEKALQNIYDSLRPGGTLLVLTYSKESPYWHFLESVLSDERFQSYRSQSAYKTILSASEHTQTLQEIGFTCIQSSLEDKLAVYTTPQDLQDYIKGWLHCFVPLSPPLETLFLDAAGKLATAAYRDPASQDIQIPYSKLVIKAQKSIRDEG